MLCRALTFLVLVVAALIGWLVNSAIVTMAYDRELKTILPFQQLTTRKRKLEEDEAVKGPTVCLYPFDLIYLNGESYVKKPFSERRDAGARVSIISLKENGCTPSRPTLVKRWACCSSGSAKPDAATRSTRGRTRLVNHAQVNGALRVRLDAGRGPAGGRGQRRLAHRGRDVPAR